MVHLCFFIYYFFVAFNYLGTNVRAQQTLERNERRRRGYSLIGANRKAKLLVVRRDRYQLGC